MEAPETVSFRSRGPRSAAKATSGGRDGDLQQRRKRHAPEATSEGGGDDLQRKRSSGDGDLQRSECFEN